MNDVGGSDSGKGLRAVKSSRTSDNNFEYDDEWDVGIGNLISDLDADIEKNNEETRSGESPSEVLHKRGCTSTVNISNPDAALVQSKTSPDTSQSMHIPNSTQSSATVSVNVKKGKFIASVTVAGPAVCSSTAEVPNPCYSQIESLHTPSVSGVGMDHPGVGDKGLKMKIKRTKPGTKSVEAKHEIVKSDGSGASASATASVIGGHKSFSVTDSKSSTTPSSFLQKDLKDRVTTELKLESVLDTGADQHTGSKNKASKKSSIQRKPKLGDGSCSNADSKSDGSPLETKTSTSITSSSVLNTQNASISTNFPVAPANISTSTSSAFVKTSLNCAMKAQSQSTVMLGNELNSHQQSRSSVNVSGVPRSAQTGTALQINFQQGPANASSVSPSAKVEKGRISPAVACTNSISDKSRSDSPSCLKKSRITTEKNPSGPGQDTSPNFRSTAGSKAAGPVTGSISVSGNSEYSSTSTPATGPVGSKEVDCVYGASSFQEQSNLQDVCIGTSVGTVTEPDCLGPCEPGTSVTLEGIVWHETENGVLVVNVTWRGKTYVGTLLDCTKNDWASPRFCDSPTSDLEMRTPKNRGKRGRVQTATPVSDPSASEHPKASTKLRNGAKGRRGSSGNVAFVAPVSPIKSELPKRKTRGSETESQEESSTGTVKNLKRLKFTKDSLSAPNMGQTCSASTEGSGVSFSPNLIECPEPNCSKKYKHINGLRYHQSHAHSNNFAVEDSDSNLSTASVTNLNNVQDNIYHSNEDLGRIEGSRTDADILEGSVSGTEALSTPTTPVKGIQTESDSKPSEINLSDAEMFSKNMVESDVKVALSTKFSGCDMDTNINDRNLDEGVEKVLGNEIKGSTPRIPILTVPTLPFLSLQNRSSILSHNSSLQRIQESTETGSSSSSKAHLEQEGSGKAVNKSCTPVLPCQSKVGVPWQPHAHSPGPAPLISLPGHTAQITSSLQPQQSVSIPTVYATSISSNKEHDIGSRDSRTNPDVTELGSKKLKHKKKKDKNERERYQDGKLRSSESASRSRGISKGISDSGRSQNGSDRGQNNEEGRNSVESVMDDNLSGRRDSECGTGNGTSRDDPQSPAYSDISDANDSGAEFDTKSMPKEQSSKVIPSVPDLKMESVAGTAPTGQNMPPFYSPFYSPHSLETPYPHANPNGGQIKLERSSGATNVVPIEDQCLDKSKAKPTATIPQHLQGHLEDRRSPKMDYHAKYLPHQHQQHFYPYPYTSYHYEQPPYGLVPEPSYSSNRGGMEDKERDCFDEHRIRIGGKTNPSGEAKYEIAGLPSLSIHKQESQSERDRNSKNSRHIPITSAGDERQSINPGESKPEFTSDSEAKKHGSAGGSHFQTSPSSSSKQLKETKREERYRDNEGKDSGKHRTSSGLEQATRHKGMDVGSSSADKDIMKSEGSKPTMETQGPPPPPTAGSYAYMPPGYLQGGPFGLPFDPNHPLYRQVMVPSPYPGSPYMHPGTIPRFQQQSTGASILPEDLSRPGPGGPGTASKALDLLQHHAAQYYASHKIHELQERALKSPSPQIITNQSAGSSISGNNLSSSPSTQMGLGTPSRGSLATSAGTDRKSGDPMKDPKAATAPLSAPVTGTETSRSPPVHHVHTHMHSHTHIGYPIIPTVPPQYSPHYGVLSTPPSGSTSSVIPPFPSQKPT